MSHGLDFVAVDVETANARRGSICALGVALVRNGHIQQRHSWLCRPPAGLGHFDAFNIGLHGITPGMVAGQPTFAERLQDLLALADNLHVVAHNAGFDLGAIREACAAADLPWPQLTYACTLVMARRSLALISYRLPVVAHALGVDLGRHHDAGHDASAAAGILLALAEHHGATSLDDLACALKVIPGRLTQDDWIGCQRRPVSRADRPAANPDADPAHPLYGTVIAFTGALSIRRAEAWQRVADLGATVATAPNRRTQFLVIGDGFRGDDPADFHTGKARKATMLRGNGYPIEVLTEADLIDLLNEPRLSGIRKYAESVFAR